MAKRRILAISPHADDVEIGCGGFLAREIELGADVHVVVVVTRDQFMIHQNTSVPSVVRNIEFEEAMNTLGVPFNSRYVLLPGEDEDFDLCSYPKSKMIQKLDDLIRQTAATTVILPMPSFHQEHEYTYQCGISATRTTKFQSTVREVFAYEQPSVNWGPSASWDASRGGCYVDISLHLEVKLQSIAQHKSQCYRKGQSLISMEAVQQLARLRGIEAGVEHAELLFLLRSLI